MPSPGSDRDGLCHRMADVGGSGLEDPDGGVRRDDARRTHRDRARRTRVGAHRDRSGFTSGKVGEQRRASGRATPIVLEQPAQRPLIEVFGREYFSRLDTDDLLARAPESEPIVACHGMSWMRPAITSRMRALPAHSCSSALPTIACETGSVVEPAAAPPPLASASAGVRSRAASAATTFDMKPSGGRLGSGWAGGQVERTIVAPGARAASIAAARSASMPYSAVAAASASRQQRAWMVRLCTGVTRGAPVAGSSRWW